MKLTARILNAIAEMSSRVEAGTVADYRGYDRPEDEKAYQDAVDAGIWARQVMRKRTEKKGKKK